MRIFIALFCFVFLLNNAFAIDSKNHPNMLNYVSEKKGPYLEVWYSGRMQKLEIALMLRYKANKAEIATAGEDSSRWVWSGIEQPNFLGADYKMSIETVETSKQGKLLRFRFYCPERSLDMLDQISGFVYSNMELIQDAIDESLMVSHQNKEQNPNQFYLFQPDKSVENLYGYLFLYSKAPIDTVVYFLASSLISECESVGPASWIQDSTYRIDNLRMNALGYFNPFSLFIEVSSAEKGYTQYV